MSVSTIELFIISRAASKVQVHVRTLRIYEAEGLIRPQRSKGDQRLFSNSDLARVRLIRKLTQEHGINLAGVRVILGLMEKYNLSIEEILNDA